MTGGFFSFQWTKEDPGSFRIQSHGWTILRSHIFDWIILVLLIGLDIGINKIEPFRHYVGADQLEALKFPLKDPTVPFRAVQGYSLLLPPLIFLLVYIIRKNAFDLHNSILGVLYAVFIAAVITDGVKNAIGRPRPSFFWRCFPEGHAVFDKIGNVVCNGEVKDVNEGYRSFPSGHTSWSFASLGFLSFYLAGKLNLYNNKGRISKTCLVILPLLGATAVGITRIDDYWHHWTDVLAGALLGLTVAFFCYHQLYPSPLHTHGSCPRQYFQALEETNATASSQSISLAQRNVRPLNDQQLGHLEGGDSSNLSNSTISLIEHFTKSTGNRK